MSLSRYLSKLGTLLNSSGQVPAAGLAAGAARTNFGAGAVLQITQNDYMTWTSSTSTSLIATGLQCSITPTLSTSKIVILVNVNGMYNSSTSNTVLFSLYKNGSSLVSLDGSFSNNVVNYGASSAYQYVDSPASTSALTYALYFRSSGGYNMGINNYTVSNPSTTRSSILLMEIAQ